MSASREELLAALDDIEKQLSVVIAESVGEYVTDNGVEPVSIQQARIRYGEGGLWLRDWIEKG